MKLLPARAVAFFILKNDSGLTANHSTYRKHPPLTSLKNSHITIGVKSISLVIQESKLKKITFEPISNHIDGKRH